ncbi:MAG: zinc-binding dehydrogenase [Chloroflexi bacterium]|nr:zinc-binding dehydrogenase [Chloroflexota bacterium]|tara:strand:+ start:1219 stop:2205 length:987 start_codon:yes stop_codon:yes gene_type:complete
MKAVICSSVGGIDSLTLSDVPSPALGESEVLVRAEAASVNFADILLAQGKYQEKPQYPFSPGLEVAGVIIDVAVDVDQSLVGKRVMAPLRCGGFAEEVVVPAVNLVEIPDDMSGTVACTIPIAYGTSYLALADRAGLTSDETVLVLGASGGVGLTAVEIAHALGARVIAAASSQEKLDVARSYGADHLINYSTHSISAEVEHSVGGVDVVFDPVGGDAFEASMHCVNPGARILIIGFASGKIPEIKANHLLVKDVAAMGFSVGKIREKSPERMREGLQQIVEWWREDKIHPYISDQFPLKDYREALELIRDRRATGKIVLNISNKDSQ